MAVKAVLVFLPVVLILYCILAIPQLVKCGLRGLPLRPTAALIISCALAAAFYWGAVSRRHWITILSVAALASFGMLGLPLLAACFGPFKPNSMSAEACAINADAVRALDTINHFSQTEPRRRIIALNRFAPS
ncbi:MAG: hypothetical protein ACP5MD_15940, partial [Verrucomicrobiia bacterium]